MWLMTGDGVKTPLSEQHIRVIAAAASAAKAKGGTQKEQQAHMDLVMEAHDALVSSNEKCKLKLDQVKRELKALRDRIDQIEQSL